MRETGQDPEKLSEEDKRIILSIRNAPLPMVSQKEVEAACKAAVFYYAGKQSIRNGEFWKVAFSCFTTGFAFFWFLSAFLLGSIVVISMLNGSDENLSVSLMMAVSPIPALTYVIRELQYRDENLIQLEKTCKYAPAKIYFVRLWAGMLGNALFVLAAGLVMFPRHENLVQLYFCAFIVLFLVGAAALICMAFLDNGLPLSLMLAAWVLGTVCLLRQSEIMEIVMNMGTGMLAAGALLSFALFAAAATGSTARIYARG